MNKKIVEGPQFVKKSYQKMAIFQLEHLKKIGGAPQFVKNYTQKCLIFAKWTLKSKFNGEWGGVPLQHIVHMNFWVAFYITSPSTQYNTLVLCTCGNWLWMHYQISCVRRKPKYNPKLLMDFPFNYLYRVNQMKHNLFQSQKITLNFWVRKKNNNNAKHLDGCSRQST